MKRPDPEFQNQTLRDLLLDEVAAFLASESSRLDLLLQFSEHLRASLNDRSPERLEQIASQQSRLEQSAQDVSQHVAEMKRSIGQALRIHPEQATLRAFMRVLTHSERERFSDIRAELTSKLRQLQSITIGNQAALFYSMEYYRCFVDQLSGGRFSDGASYSADGQMQGGESSILVRKAC
jgi:FlgN protein